VNWLLAGFVTFIEIPIPTAPPATGLLLVIEIVGAEALDANTGVATGMRMSKPENARSANTSPELNFVTYALEGVFILYFRTSGPIVRI